MVPKHRRTRTDPRTPDVGAAASKRAWDGIYYKVWRRQLHAYDPEGGRASATDVVNAQRRGVRAAREEAERQAEAARELYTTSGVVKKECLDELDVVGADSL